jgi:DNA-binding response OmpR family regulator
MRKIYIDLPQHIRDAVAFNLPDYALLNSSVAAELSLSSKDLPEGKIRLGILLDKITRDFGSSFEVGKIAFDLKIQTASIGAKKIKLTEKEQGLIEYLYKQAAYVSRDEILQNVWRYSANTNTRTLESHVHRLNQKFEKAFDTKIIEHKDGAYGLAS